MRLQKYPPNPSLSRPARMYGVPGLSFNGIAPGETYVGRFDVKQGRTYWYHSHSAFQEQLGLYGALIEPREPEPFRYDRTHGVILSDWTNEHPERVFAELKKQPDYLRIVLVEDTMMTHPIHLHGMWSGLEGDDGEFLAFARTCGQVRPGTSAAVGLQGLAPY